MLDAVSGEENKFKREEGEGEEISALQGMKGTPCTPRAVAKKGKYLQDVAFSGSGSL